MAEQDTALALGSGDVPVLGTPAVLALMERAACAAVAPALGSADTSVGTWADLNHVAASKVGAEVVAEAVLIAVNGRTLDFVCEAREGSTVVATAKHRRSVVDRERFLARD